MRKAVAAIRWRNTLSAVPLEIQKTADQANNPAYRRLKCFFVLTKGMSVIGPRPVTLDETYEYSDAREEVLACKPGITGWWAAADRNDSTWESGQRQAREFCAETLASLEPVRN